jgi:NADPH:quinone reductase-like Zn-dependent oxidoreductase
MKAYRLHDFAGDSGLRLDEVPKPKAKPGEVVVEVKASGVNPVDWKIAAGYLQGMLNHTLPITLGCEVSGLVADVGSDVSGWALGEQVFGYLSLVRCGGFAEYAVALSSELAKKPRTVSHVEAAAIPVAALTSWQAMVEHAGLSQGQTVLIHGASGGVGSIGVQLAKAIGAKVVGTASGANEAFVRGLGVDTFVDYRSTRFEDVVRGVDVVFDTIGGDTQTRSFHVLKPGGFLVSITESPDPELGKARGIRTGFTGVQPSGAQLTRFAEWIAAKNVRPEIAATYPLARLMDAFQHSQTGRTRGKLVIEF